MSTQTKPLSPRHERFVAEYLKDFNATRAYIRAGYAAHSAQGNACKLLGRPDVRAAVEAGRQRLAVALEVSVDRLAAQYAKVAFADIDFVAVDGDGRVRIDLTKARRHRPALPKAAMREPGSRWASLARWIRWPGSWTCWWRGRRKDPP